MEPIEGQIAEVEVTQKWLNENINFDHKKYDELSLSQIVEKEGEIWTLKERKTQLMKKRQLRMVNYEGW